MLLIAAFTLALGIGQPEPAETPPVDDPWAVRPALMATDYPQAALDAGLDGEATVRCQVTPEGAPLDCEVVAEEPAGYGFGAAAVGVVARGRLSSAAVAEMGSDPSFTVRIPFTIAPDQPVVTLDNADGVVTLRCRLSRTFQAEGCVVLEEAPEGQGFGEAAIRIVEGQPIGSEAIDGHRPGTTFTVRIPFSHSEH